MSWLSILLTGVAAYLGIAIIFAYMLNSKWDAQLVNVCWVWPVLLGAIIYFWLCDKLCDPKKIKIPTLEESPRVTWKQEKKKL